jgi:FlaA1/EpsC-like NDP-sugar epimerase
MFGGDGRSDSSVPTRHVSGNMLAFPPNVEPKDMVVSIMNVLVTGGAGFIGSYVVRELMRANHTIIAFDLQIAQNSLDDVLNEGQRASVNLVAGDIADGAGLCETIGKYEVETLAHLASPPNDPWIAENYAPGFSCSDPWTHPLRAK